MVGAALPVGGPRRAVGRAGLLLERLRALLQLAGGERGGHRHAAPSPSAPLARLERVERLLQPPPVAGRGEAARRRGARRGERGRVRLRRRRRDRQHRPRLAARAQRRVGAEHDVAQPGAERGGDVDRRRPARRRPRLEGALVGVAREPLGARPRRAPRSAGRARRRAAASAAPARRSRGSCRSSPRRPRARAPPRRARGSAARIRSRSSPAAFSVKVSARIEPTGTPSRSTASTQRSAITAVLPEPALAASSAEPARSSIAARCSGVKATVIRARPEPRSSARPADRRVRAAVRRALLRARARPRPPAARARSRSARSRTSASAASSSAPRRLGAHVAAGHVVAHQPARRATRFAHSAW